MSAAKRGRGRPPLSSAGESGTRFQVHLPPTVADTLRKDGEGSLSQGIVRANARPKKRPKKPRLVEVIDPSEIEAIKAGEWAAPLGGEFEGRWLAESSTLAAWRKLRAEGKI